MPRRMCDSAWSFWYLSETLQKHFHIFGVFKKKSSHVSLFPSSAPVFLLAVRRQLNGLETGSNDPPRWLEDKILENTVSRATGGHILKCTELQFY